VTHIPPTQSNQSIVWCVVNNRVKEEEECQPPPIY
jgi:hypothetical protein